MAGRSLALLLSAVSVSAGTPAADLRDIQRAKTKVPGADFRGRDFEDMSNNLNKHLRRNFKRTEDCASFTVEQLLALQEQLFGTSDPELVAIYAMSKDHRRERHNSLEALRSHWASLLTATPRDLLPMLHDGLCHEVVMRFVHQTSEEKKGELMADTSFVLPMLPKQRHMADWRHEAAAAHKEYKDTTARLQCHARLVPRPSPEAAKECDAQLTKVCGKRGELMKDACDACTQAHSSDLDLCLASEPAAWCDHLPACLGSETCPVWPAVFAAPFALHTEAPSPPIEAAKSMFYYKYDAEMQVQTVDYQEVCLPGVSKGPTPCKLFFNPQGIYLSQPGQVDCCKVVAGVGAVPPEFLQTFKLVQQNVLAPDMIGNQVKCDEWEGIAGFSYWTVGREDSIYKNYGHDILFKDGPTGAFWRWGNFTALPEGDLFTLPAGDCESDCSKVLAVSELQALHQDPHVKRAMLHHLGHSSVAAATAPVVVV